jgi:hypothetical protein
MKKKKISYFRKKNGKGLVKTIVGVVLVTSLLKALKD